MTRKELREKAELVVTSSAWWTEHDDPDVNTLLNMIESFGLEIAKSVAEENAKLVEGWHIKKGGFHEIAFKIREYAKRLEGDEK